MTRAKTTNPDFLNGVPELLILRLLSRRPMHGYDVVRAIREATSERLDFGEGSIYPILHRLERTGSLEGAKERVGNRARIVYRVTPAGLARLEESTAAWAAVVRAVNQALQGGGDAGPALA
jgi:PadR family transcriptional regulator PadR